MAKTKTIKKVYDKFGRLLREEIYHFEDTYQVTVDSEGVPHLRKIGVEETCEIKECSHIYKF